MKAKTIVSSLVGLLLVVSQVACQLLTTGSPPPGWHDDVRKLFVDENAFPPEWKPQLLQEADAAQDANHVHRRFSAPPSSGIGSQDIWRAYSIENAEKKYSELRESQFQPRLPPEEMVAPWEPPPQIDFQSTVADDYYFACGWEEWASCQFLARYDNYVTYLRLDRHAVMNGLESEGLTYEQIEAVLNAVDNKFQVALDQFSQG